MAARKDDEQREARRLRSEGKSLRSIAGELGVSLGSASVWTRDITAPLPPGMPHPAPPAGTVQMKRCGLADPLVLEFDHVADKTAGISSLVHEGYALARIQAEVAGCEVVCANCHRRRTNLRAGGSWRVDLEARVPAHRPIQRRNLRFLLDYLQHAACVGCGERTSWSWNSTT